MHLGRGNGDEIHGLRLMREGDDPRDIYWRKSTLPEQRVLRERATDTRRDVAFSIDSSHAGKAPDDVIGRCASSDGFAMSRRALSRILKRGDGVSVMASGASASAPMLPSGPIHYCAFWRCWRLHRSPKSQKRSKKCRCPREVRLDPSDHDRRFGGAGAAGNRCWPVVSSIGGS